MIRTVFALVVLLPSLLLGGCAVSQPSIPLAKFTAGDLVAVRDFAVREATEGDEENLALVRNVQGQCELLLGDLEAARRAFDEAAQIMGNWSTGSGEAIAAIVGSESSKTYKGDPYEKAMNAFYRAYCYLRRGEVDNARAACKRGILADAEVGEEKFQADNALLFWFAGRMSRLMGQQSEADGFFGEARAANEFALAHSAVGDAAVPALQSPGQGNLVLLFECGMGPEKYGDGAQDELARFKPRPHPAVRARAAVDGQPVGTSSILLDVEYQARTLGGTVMEGIRQGKAVFRAASAIGGAVLIDQAARQGFRGDTARTQAIVGTSLLLLAALTSTSADVRHWPTLPATVQVLTIEVPPGEHVVDVEFLDASGRTLPRLSQRVAATVPAGGEGWYLFRSVPSSSPAASPAATLP